MSAGQKRLGLIGGMSWESTAIYYRELNRGVGQRLGGLHSADLLLASVDFQDIVSCVTSDEWERAADQLSAVARRLQDAGVDGIALAVNTMHKIAPSITDATEVPFFDIRNAVADAARTARVDAVVLLGTNYVVQEDFYRGWIERSLGPGARVVALPDDEQHFVHNTIYDELAKGIVRTSTRERIAQAITSTVAAHRLGGVVLACTELPLLDLDSCVDGVPVFDSTRLHVETCLNWMLHATGR